MPVDRSSHATGTLIVGANGKLAAPVRPGKVNLADTPATLLGKNVGKGVKPITFRGQGGLIYANGQKFAIKGANWFGSEDRNGDNGGDSDTADEAEDDAGGGERRANASETELVSAVDRIFAPKGRCEL